MISSLAIISVSWPEFGFDLCAGLHCTRHCARLPCELTRCVFPITFTRSLSSRTTDRDRKMLSAHSLTARISRQQGCKAFGQRAGERYRSEHAAHQLRGSCNGRPANISAGPTLSPLRLSRQQRAVALVCEAASLQVRGFSRLVRGTP